MDGWLALRFFAEKQWVSAASVRLKTDAEAAPMTGFTLNNSSPFAPQLVGADQPAARKRSLEDWALGLLVQARLAPASVAVRPALNAISSQGQRNAAILQNALGFAARSPSGWARSAASARPTAAARTCSAGPSR